MEYGEREGNKEMKFTLTFKFPDSVDVESIVKDNLPGSYTDDENESVCDAIDEDIRERIEGEICLTVDKFVKWREMIRVEFDTEAGTCVVLPVKG
jgi:hypothetical protein